MFQNMNPLATSTAIWEIAIMLIGAFILGYWLCKCKCKNMSFKKGDKTNKTIQHNVSIKSEKKPNYVWSTASSQKDDLKKIEGIGPAIEKVLNAAGINSFSKLAETSQEEIKKLLDAAGSHFQIHDGDTWAEQSALLRDNKIVEFEALVEKLKSGKRV